jgi:hypothetical protein
MNAIAIDLATATNVLGVAVNLFVLALNLMVLARLQSLTFPLGPSDQPQLIPRLRTPKAEAGSTSQALPISSASDHRMAEREKMKKEAEKLEELAMVTEYP